MRSLSRNPVGLSSSKWISEVSGGLNCTMLAGKVSCNLKYELKADVPLNLERMVTLRPGLDHGYLVWYSESKPDSLFQLSRIVSRTLSWCTLFYFWLVSYLPLPSCIVSSVNKKKVNVNYLYRCHRIYWKF